MTALLYQVLHHHPRPDRSAVRLRQLPKPVPVCPASAARDAPLAAAGERLATGTELNFLRSMHPRLVSGIQ